MLHSFTSVIWFTFLSNIQRFLSQTVIPEDLLSFSHLCRMRAAPQGDSLCSPSARVIKSVCATELSQTTNEHFLVQSTVCLKTLVRWKCRSYANHMHYSDFLDCLHNYRFVICGFHQVSERSDYHVNKILYGTPCYVKWQNNIKIPSNFWYFLNM